MAAIISNTVVTLPFKRATFKSNLFTLPHYPDLNRLDVDVDANQRNLFRCKRFCMSIRNFATKQSHRFSLMGLLVEPCLASQCYHYLAIVCVTLCDPSKPLGYAPWLDRRLPSSEKMILKVYRIAASVNIDYWGQNSFIGA